MKKVIVYGTFDLFHIGHLNFIKKAREYGDYLIVGVSTDEFNSIKGKKSFIPYEQRKEIVASLKYVDEVIPEENWEQKVSDIKKYNIDTVVTVEEWKSRFEYLKEYADVVYLKSTPDISSTMIKEGIAKNYKKVDKINPFMKLFIYIFKYLLRFIYFFMKLFKTDNKKVVFISRMSNEIPLEYQMYINKLKENDVKIVVLCKRMGKGFKEYIKYFIEILKQMYHLSTSRVCILDTYCIPVSILKHKKNLKIIQTWHAMMAIKKFGYQNLNKDDGRNEELARILDMHKNYDYVISGSKAMTPFFSEAFNINSSKIHEIGSPIVDYLLRNKETIKENVYSKYPEFKNKKNVLYVPTFRKGRKIQDFDLINNFDYENYNLIIKYHSLTKKKINDTRVYDCSDFCSFDLLTVADYIITDYSSIAAEASLFDKPILFYAYDLEEYKKKNGLNIDLYEEMPGCVFKDATSLLNKIKEDNFNIQDIRNFRDKYVSNTSGTSTLLLIEYILSNIGEVHEENKVLSSVIYKSK